MQRFAVKNKSKDTIAILSYNEKNKKWGMDIDKKADKSTCPVLFFCLMEKNKYHLNDKLCNMFIEDRIIPSSRQNINQFLKKNKLKEYNPYELIKMNKGKCCMDDCYVELDK